MSFANKPSRPDSRDTAKLRAEYETKARAFRDAQDPASKTKLRDDKNKAFQRVVEQMTHERRDTLAATHKVLVGMGKMKTDDQIAAERAKFEENRKARVGAEAR